MEHSPLAQITAGRFSRRFIQLLLGLALYGFSMTLMIRGAIGVNPWDVFHTGVAKQSDWSIGAVVIATGFGVLLLWVPLKQVPGLGTLANAILIGLVTNWTLPLLSTPDQLPGKVCLLFASIFLNGLATAAYIGSGFGAGPRDGLMTGLSRVSGLSIRLVRTLLEVTVLSIGWFFGGAVGFGTVAYALLIGPIVQWLLPKVTVPLPSTAGKPENLQHS